MKIIAFIMACLVLALSVMPCADNGITAKDGKTKTEIAKSNPEKGDTQQDDCSPFCTCHCCAGNSINHFIVSIVVSPPCITKIKTADMPAHPIDAVLPVWQPPQI